MNRSRGLLFGIGAAGIVLAGLLAWLAAGYGSEDGAGDVLAARQAAGAQAAQLPGAAGDTPDSLPTALEGSLPPVAAPTADAAAAGQAPTRLLRGVLRMADGSALPEGLAVFSASRCPPPRLFSIRDFMGGENPDAVDDTFGSDDPEPEPDAEGHEVLADRDGRFELAAPTEAVWLGVRGEAVFVSPSVQVPADAAEDLDVTLERGASIAGRVLDAKGDPIARANVRAATPFDPYSVLDSSSRMAALGSRHSDDEGRFLFAQVPTGLSLQVLATQPGAPKPELVPDAGAAHAGPSLQPARAEVHGLQPGERREVELVLMPAGIVRGLVKLVDGSGLADARVSLRRSSLNLKDISLAQSFKGEVQTDAEGRFEFDDVADGSYVAVLAQAGYRLAHAKDVSIVSGSVVEGVELLAEEGLEISGRVLDAAGAPLKGVRVQGYPKPSMLAFGSAFERDLYPRAHTAEDGTFAVRGYDPGDVRLRCSRDGLRAQSLDVEAGSRDVEVRMEALSSLSGIVVSLADGEPVTSFSVSAKPSDGLFKPGDWMGTEAESSFERLIRPRGFHDRQDGTFTLENVVPGTFNVTVTAKGFGAHVEPDIEVDTGGRRGLVIMLEPECAVVGLAVDARSGAPVAGAIVRSGAGGGVMQMMNEMATPAPFVRSDSQGRFRLGGLSPGTVRLSIDHPGYRALGVPEFVLAHGEEHDLGTLGLSTGASVHGTVFDTLGPVPDVPVMVSNATGTTLKRTSTDAQGKYSVSGLGAGTYNVMRADFAMDLGEDSSPMSMLENLVMEPVTLAEDEDRRVDLHVQTKGGVSLVGQVKDAAGPVSGAMLTLLPETAGGKMGWANTGKDGEYKFAHVEPGRYGLTVIPTDTLAGGSGGQPSSAVFASLVLGAKAEQRHDVELPGGILNGVVVSKEDGHVVPRVRLVLERTDAEAHEVAYVAAMGGRVGEAYSDESGAFRFRHLPGGNYAVVAGGKGLVGLGAAGWAQKRVENLSVLEGGPGFTVKVEVEPAALVAGTVRDPGGQPLDGVGVWVLDAAGLPRSRFSEEASDSSGRYEVGDLRDGAWTLAFMDSGHALTIVRGVLVRTGESTPLDVTLPPGTSLRLDLKGRPAAGLDVSVIGPDGSSLPCRLLSLADLAGMSQADGTLTLGTYAPGNYRVQVRMGAEQLLDSGVTLVGGSAAKVLDLPEP